MNKQEGQAATQRGPWGQDTSGSKEMNGAQTGHRKENNKYGLNNSSLSIVIFLAFRQRLRAGHHNQNDRIRKQFIPVPTGSWTACNSHPVWSRRPVWIWYARVKHEVPARYTGHIVSVSPRDLAFSSLITSRSSLIMQQLFLVMFINHIIPKMTQPMAVPFSCTSTIVTFSPWYPTDLYSELSILSLLLLLYWLLP